MATRSEALLQPAALEAEGERAREGAQVARALAGDVEAFRAIVLRHHPGLFRLAVRTLGDESEAEDVVQETFARAYRRLDQFDCSYRVSTWLYRIALNICRDHLKSPRKRERPHDALTVPEDLPADERQGADARLDRKRLAERMRRAMDRLSPSYREVIVLKDLQELSYEEMREITGAPVTALKIRVLRARAKLRQMLEEESP